MVSFCYVSFPLQYTDDEVERCYEEFYEDVHTEFLKFGEIVNFKVADCYLWSNAIYWDIHMAVHYFWASWFMSHCIVMEINLQRDEKCCLKIVWFPIYVCKQIPVVTWKEGIFVSSSFLVNEFVGCTLYIMFSIHKTECVKVMYVHAHCMVEA